jgi:hypothetical protein
MADWMPVFLVIPAKRTHHAAHPDHKGKTPNAVQVRGTDFLQRIGTAVKQEDGGYLVELAALPVSGKLLLKPPTKHDSRDPTSTEDR